MRGSVAWAGGAIGGSLLLWGPLFLFVRPNADDGLVGAQAMLVAEGGLPYRDYFSPLWPAADLLYGGWLRLTGTSYLSLRILTAIGLALGVGALFAVARRLVPDRVAFAVALLWGGWMAPFLDRGPYHVFGAAGIHGATWLLLRGRSTRPEGRWLAGAGVLAGVAVLFRQSYAVAALACLVAAAVVARRPRRGVLAVAAGGAFVAGGLGVWLIAAGLEADFIHQTLGFVSSSYLPSNYRGIPLLPFEMTGFHGVHPWARPVADLGIWMGAILLPVIVIGLLIREPLRSGRRLRREVLAVGVVAAGLFLSALYRTAAPVAWASSGLALAMVAIAVPRWLGRRAGSVILVAVMALAALPGAAAWLQQAGKGPGLAPVPLRHSVGPVLVSRRAAPAVERLTRFMEEREGERIALLPALKALYLATGRPPPISFVILRRGYNTEDQVRRAQQELLERNVRWVLYAPGLRDFGSAGGPWRFESFLEERYRRRGTLAVLQFGPVLLYERR